MILDDDCSSDRECRIQVRSHGARPVGFVDATLITWGSIAGGEGSDENSGAVAVTVQELRTQQRELLLGAEGYRKLG